MRIPNWNTDLNNLPVAMCSNSSDINADWWAADDVRIILNKIISDLQFYQHLGMTFIILLVPHNNID